MKQIYFCIIILMLLPVFTEAKLVNKPLNITIGDCYSVDIEVELEEGAESDVEFIGCTKETPTEFHCNCLNKDNNNFSIIMKTDDTMVRDIRQYEIYLSAKYFDTYRKTMTVDMEDGGEYYEVSTESWRERINRAKELIKIEYVNVTVYEDRLVEVPIETIIYEDRIINNTITEYINITKYVENTTKIEKLEKEIKNQNYLAITLSIVSLILLSIIIYNVKKD